RARRAAAPDQPAAVRLPERKAPVRNRDSHERSTATAWLPPVPPASARPRVAGGTQRSAPDPARTSDLSVPHPTVHEASRPGQLGLSQPARTAFGHVELLSRRVGEPQHYATPQGFENVLFARKIYARPRWRSRGGASKEVAKHRDRDGEVGAGPDTRRRAGLRRGYLRRGSVDRLPSPQPAEHPNVGCPPSSPLPSPRRRRLLPSEACSRTSTSCIGPTWSPLARRR